MSLFPPGHRLQQAVRWISDRLKAEPGTPVQGLVHRAIAQFDLTPKEGDELIGFYRQSGGGEQGSDDPS
jgi:hypothetical protein